MSAARLAPADALVHITKAHFDNMAPALVNYYTGHPLMAHLQAALDDRAVNNNFIEDLNSVNANAVYTPGYGYADNKDLINVVSYELKGLHYALKVPMTYDKYMIAAVHGVYQIGDRRLKGMTAPERRLHHGAPAFVPAGAEDSSGSGEGALPQPSPPKLVEPPPAAKSGASAAGAAGGGGGGSSSPVGGDAAPAADGAAAEPAVIKRNPLREDGDTSRGHAAVAAAESRRYQYHDDDLQRSIERDHEYGGIYDPNSALAARHGPNPFLPRARRSGETIEEYNKYLELKETNDVRVTAQEEAYRAGRIHSDCVVIEQMPQLERWARETLTTRAPPRHTGGDGGGGGGSEGGGGGGGEARAGGGGGARAYAAAAAAPVAGVALVSSLSRQPRTRTTSGADAGAGAGGGGGEGADVRQGGPRSGTGERILAGRVAAEGGSTLPVANLLKMVLREEELSERMVQLLSHFTVPDADDPAIQPNMWEYVTMTPSELAGAVGVALGVNLLAAGCSHDNQYGIWDEDSSHVNKGVLQQSIVAAMAHATGVRIDTALAIFTCLISGLITKDIIMAPSYPECPLMALRKMALHIAVCAVTTNYMTGKREAAGGERKTGSFVSTAYAYTRGVAIKEGGDIHSFHALESHRTGAAALLDDWETFQTISMRLINATTSSAKFVHSALNKILSYVTANQPLPHEYSAYDVEYLAHICASQLTSTYNIMTRYFTDTGVISSGPKEFTSAAWALPLVSGVRQSGPAIEALMALPTIIANFRSARDEHARAHAWPEQKVRFGGAHRMDHRGGGRGGGSGGGGSGGFRS